MRHDSRAGLHGQDGRPQLHVEGRQEVERDDRRGTEVGGEDVRLADDGLARPDARDAGGLRALVRILGHVGVVFDAGRLGAELLRRHDGDLAVARAEVEVDVVRPGLRHGEHALDDLVGRWHPDHVLAGLADLRLEFLRMRWKRRRYRDEECNEQCSAGNERHRVSCLEAPKSSRKGSAAGRNTPAADLFLNYRYSTSAAWSARRERSPRESVMWPACAQSFMRSTT